MEEDSLPNPSWTRPAIEGHWGRRALHGLTLLAGVLGIIVLATCAARRGQTSDPTTIPPTIRDDAFRSAYAVAFSSDGSRVAVTDHTAGALVVIETATGQVESTIPLGGEATGVTFGADDLHVYVARFEHRQVVEIDIAQGAVKRRFDVGPYPQGLAIAPDRGLLMVAAWGSDRVQAIDLKHGKVLADLPAVRQPTHVAVSPDGSVAIASNLLPAGRSTDKDFAAAVSVYDLKAMARRSDVALPVGSSAARGVAIDPNRKWAYVVHTLGRYHIPTTQIERGWVNTNALSIIDLANATCHATVLLDRPTRGAADPWGLAVSNDARWLYATIAGTHELGIIDLSKLHKLIDTKDRATLANDLTGLHRTQVLQPPAPARPRPARRGGVA
jgi:YVTN family beta-propeller protein